ncbi:hypothetical protein OPQ81_003629 [Rhizoctonia solani]|nr:hypothetical protein OPQ81_003629 [Rhizoctonia solani]
MSDSPKDKNVPQPEDTEKVESTKQVEQVAVASVNEDAKGVENAAEETEKDAGEGDKETEEQEQTDDANPPLPDEPVPSQTEWQAIWSPSHNAYYFFNARTAETTWSTEQSEPKEAITSEKPPPDLSYLNGIDPELAYLDPTLAVPSAGSKGPVPTFTARFGARDGRFTAMDARRPEHLSEAARAQRMSSVYYDTEAWERQIAERDAQAKADAESGVGEKRKRLTKADIERFKEQKKAKKAMRNAWLRD